MKTNILKLFLLVILISCGRNKPDVISSLTVDKTKNNYYKTVEGKILDSTTYLSNRRAQLKRLKEISSSFRLYEKLKKEYERNDSVVYSYTWNFSDNIEAEIEADKKVMKNLGTIYPISNVKTLEGNTINIDALKGKPTLVNLWFIACKPCIEEMPALNRIKSKCKDRFNFISVTVEKSEDVKKFLEKTKFDFTHITDSEELTTDLGFNGFPINLFLDKNGVIKKIEGNVHFKNKENGETDYSEGEEEFINILKSME